MSTIASDDLRTRLRETMARRYGGGASGGGDPLRERLRAAMAARYGSPAPVQPQTIPATAADLLPGGNFYGAGLGGEFADSPYGPTGSPFQGERQNAATALRLMEADRLRSTPPAEAVAAGLASDQNQGLGGAFMAAASGGALDTLLASGGVPSTDVARMTAQAGGQGTYPAARFAGSLVGQLTGIAPMGPLAPVVMGGVRRQNVMERTGNEDAAMLAGAVGAASMLNPLGGVGANVAFNAAANPAATAAEELIAVQAGAEPTPEAEFNRQLLMDAAVGAGVPALHAAVSGAVRGAAKSWAERRAERRGVARQGLAEYQQAYRQGRMGPTITPEPPQPVAEPVGDAWPVSPEPVAEPAPTPQPPEPTPPTSVPEVTPPAKLPYRTLKAEAESLGVAQGEGGRKGLEQRVEEARQAEPEPQANPGSEVFIPPDWGIKETPDGAFFVRDGAEDVPLTEEEHRALKRAEIKRKMGDRAGAKTDRNNVMRGLINRLGLQKESDAFRQRVEKLRNQNTTSAEPTPPAMASPETAGPAAPAGKEPWEMTKAEYEATATDRSNREDYARAWTPIKSPRGQPNTIEFVPYQGGGGADGVLRWNDETGVGRGILAIQGGKVSDVAVDKPYRRRGIATKLYEEAARRGATESNNTTTPAAMLVRHKRSVRQAVSEGKPVPPEVLADYPDLQQAQGRAAEPVPTSTEQAKAGPFKVIWGDTGRRAVDQFANLKEAQEWANKRAGNEKTTFVVISDSNLDQTVVKDLNNETGRAAAPVESAAPTPPKESTADVTPTKVAAIPDQPVEGNGGNVRRDGGATAVPHSSERIINGHRFDRFGVPVEYFHTGDKVPLKYTQKSQADADIKRFPKKDRADLEAVKGPNGWWIQRKSNRVTEPTKESTDAVRQEEGQGRQGLLIPEQDTGAGPLAPVALPKREAAQPRQFTKADIERRLVDAHQSMGFERPETDETSIIARKFTFPNRLPAEVRDIIESYPETRGTFRVGRGGGGEDYAAAVGWERVAQEARDLGGADVRRAKEFFASEPNINPEATFLATLHDNLPKSGAKKMQSVDPKTLPEGTRFKINGEEFRVELDGSGEGRYKVLKDGDTYPDTPVDALDAIPVDRGSMESPGAKATGKRSEVKATDTLDRITAAADRVEAKARESIKRRQVPRGRNTGGTTLPADIVDYAMIAAARVVKAGVTGTRAIRDVVDRLLAEDGVAGSVDPTPIVRTAKALAKGSREGGQYSPEAFERAMGAMQERMAPKAPPVKRTVNEATGVRSTEAATVKPSEALDAGLRKSQRAAAQAWREATKVSRAEGRAQLEALRVKLRADFKAKRISHEQARAEAVKIAEGLPLRERGKLVRAITKATTPRRVVRLIEHAGRLLDAYEGREQIRTLATATARKRMLKLDEETRAKVARAALGLPESAAVSMNIAQMRQAIKDASSKLLEAMGSKDSGAVSVARIQATDRARKVVEVVHEFKRRNRVILAGKIADATRLRGELQADVAKAKPPAFIRNAQGSAVENARTPWLRRAIRTQLTNESVAMTIDGKYEGGGVAHRVLVENLWRGESGMNAQMRDFSQGLDRLAKKHGLRSLGEAMAKASGSLGRSSQQRIPVRLGDIREISLGQAMDLVAMDPATRAKVEAGNPISFGTQPNQKVSISADDFKAIEDALTPGQRAMIRDVKRMIESDLQPDLFAALRQIKGWEPERVLDYWPSARNRRLTEGRTDAYAGWSGVVDGHLEDAGFTQNRTGGDAPFMVGDFFNRAIDHARSTAAIIHLAEPIRSAEMVMLDPDTRSAMAAKFGDDVPKRVEEMLREISSLGRYQPQSTAGRAVLGLTRNVSRALTSINYRSWARQLGGVMTLATEMPAAAYRAGLAGAFGKGVFEEMTDASPFLWNRYAEAPSMMLSGLGQVGDVGSASTVGKTLGAAGRSLRRGRVVEAAGTSMKALDAIRIASFFDSIAARVAWAGFKAEAERALPNASAAERRAWAADRTEQVIRRTQNTFSVLDSSKFAQMARREPVLAPLAMFTGDSNKAFNLLYQASGRGKKEFSKVAATRAMNAAWGAAITGGAPLTLYLLASALSGNDAGRERQKDRAIQRAGGQFVREIAGTVLFGDKLVDLVAGSVQGFSGRDPLETPAGGQIAQVVTGLGQVATGVLGRMDEDPERAAVASQRFAQGVEKVLLGTATAFGVPVAPIVGDIKNVRRAIRATVAEDLIDERRQLRRVAESQRTPDQQSRVRSLDRWYERSYARATERAKRLRAAGMVAEANEIEKQREEAARAFSESLNEMASLPR